MNSTFLWIFCSITGRLITGSFWRSWRRRPRYTGMPKTDYLLEYATFSFDVSEMLILLFLSCPLFLSEFLGGVHSAPISEIWIDCTLSWHYHVVLANHDVLGSVLQTVKIDINIETDLAYALKVKECPQLLFLKGNRILYREKGVNMLFETILAKKMLRSLPIAWLLHLQNSERQMNWCKWLHICTITQRDHHGLILQKLFLHFDLFVIQVFLAYQNCTEFGQNPFILEKQKAWHKSILLKDETRRHTCIDAYVKCFYIYSFFHFFVMSTTA